MKRVFEKICLVVLTMSALACNTGFQQSSDGTYKVRIPVSDEKGQYSLQTVSLRNINDLSAMAGSTATIKNGALMRSDVDFRGRETLRIHDVGNTPTAHFVQDGEVLHPSDFDTLVMATVMYHFEQIKDFFDDLGANKGLNFPRIVLMDVKELKVQGSATQIAQDNAAYISGSDYFFANPYKGPLLPVAMNPGIWAHEWTHSFVFHTLMEKQRAYLLKKLIDPGQAETLKRFARFVQLETLPQSKTQSTQSESESDLQIQLPIPSQVPTGQIASGKFVVPEMAFTQDDVAGANEFMFASWNEGIADFFGYAYSKNPQFATASLPHQEVRNLNLFKQSPLIWTDEQSFMRDNVVHPRSGPPDFHDFGSTFANLLYQVSKEWGVHPTLVASLDFLDRYSSVFVLRHTSQYIYVGDILSSYFEGHDVSPNLCAAVEKSFPGRSARITSCTRPQH